MIRTLVILCLVAAPAFGFGFGFSGKDLKVRFDPNPFGFGKTGFISLPKTESEAVKAKWEKVKGPTPTKGYENLSTFCPSLDDVTLCEMFDDNGIIAGLQIAFDPERFTGAIFDWTVSGFRKWDVTVGGVTTTYYVTHQYYMSPEFLAIDAAKRVYNDKYIVQGDNLLVTGFHGKLFNISTNIENIKTGDEYTKQACIIGMGNHYYYKMKETLQCKEGNIFTYFPLEYHDQLVGVGFMLPGKYDTPEGKKNYFETPKKADIAMIVPTGPSCLHDYGETPGVVTMHTYFIKTPQLMTCIF